MRRMEQTNMWSGEVTAVSNPSSESQTSTAELHSVASAFEYEVFLSFRGPEVRNSFADFLYDHLFCSMIRTFRDEEELQKGETIAPSLVQAIKESKIYIPILSKSYASSKWCLQELAKMVECCGEGKGRIILPIFYFIDPRDVRHQAGPYEDAFEQHSKKHDPVTVQEWRTALQEVGHMKGWHVTEVVGQAAVVKELFSKVELHLRSNYTLVTEELVGIDSHVQEVMRLLNLDSRDEKIVGIQGIGGMGKTTIAKAVYDNICAGFNRCCFLENTRELLTKNDGIVSLQNKLISRILRDEVQVKNASEGVNMIREKVCKYKVLVVLDDVDDKFEFDQILGKLGDYSFESRFILTTRDKRVLELLPECKLYEPKEMSHAHSVHLFSRHAFGMQYIPEGYGALCDEFVKVGAKLPLALKLIGSLLFRRDRQFWEDQLMELKDLCATNNKVQASLKISYDDLSCNAKNIFLDIACFFIGEDKELPFHMWSDCKRYPESGLRTLVLRSLIKVDERNQFWMHDLVTDLGRAIVIEEDVKNPCKRSRIWSYEDAMNVLKTKEGTDQVEMLKINMLDDDSNQKLTVKTFENLARLKYLDMEFPRLTGDFSGILLDMRWLRLRGCQSLPTDLNLEKVVILDLEDCWVTDDWRGWSGIQVAHKLKVINLRGCYKLHKAPNLTQCENLEFIDLTNCFEMSGELRIGSFWNLKVVRHPWSGTIDLTGDMGKLQKLQEINTGKLVSGAQEIVLPTSLKCVTSSSPNISNLLDLKDLEELCFVHCDTAPEIPRDIWQLTKLKTLQLVLCFCNESLLVDKDGTLPPSLTSLIFKCCKHLNRLPNLGRLNNLMELRLVDVGVTEIHSLGELRMLEVLEISESHVGNLYGLDNLVQLKELTLKKCHRLENLPSLSNLIKLHSLVIIKCSLLCEIQGLVELRRSLLHLEVSYCDKLENIRFIESLEGLDSLTLDWKEILPRYGDDGQWLLAQAEDEDSLLIFCQYFNPHKPFPDLSRLRNLKQLSISWWRQLPEVTGLGRLISLKTLKMIGCTSLRRLPDLSGLKNLENLDVSCCMLLVDVTGVDRLESLQTLTFSDCWSLKELPDISSLKSLEELNVDECTELIKVAGLEKLEKLEKLRMRNCKSIKELPDMSGLKNLKELSLMGCTNLKKVKGLEALGHLPFFFMDRRLRAKYAFKRVVQAGRELKSAVRGVWDS